VETHQLGAASPGPLPGTFWLAGRPAGWATFVYSNKQKEKWVFVDSIRTKPASADSSAGVTIGSFIARLDAAKWTAPRCEQQILTLAHIFNRLPPKV
jgi:hypothetical protein